MTDAEVRAEIERFISSNFLLGSDTDLHAISSFLEEGIIDSTGVLELVTMLQETFQIEVLDQEILPENFDTLDALTSYVNRKLLKVTAET